ncbi:MAG: hypothetical protein CVT79_00240 [Alphaproteobacteria bacterium HGW-Alphaproteobacteria-18]|nr:MAG: hypothetical protein CVT79_00240 [Alphaproteobacteria bacterium HGW-Alphaproteobacteria-18]
MTRFRLLALAAASGALLAACQTPAPEAPALAPPEADIPVIVGDSAVTDACAVRESRNWAAWVNRMPGPGATPTVHVTGEVDVPTGGYSFDWEVGPMDRSMTPALKLKLIPIKPDGMATMAITPEEVHYSGPLAGSAYRSITITCGSQTLAEITDIPDAH